ncbi:hypothetical protein [Alicyclobacillus ferrooxydans]|uniref:Uncharacterized protein n=1 Tax=Alicyclobacillus ferrooxydans TaxID=471514 RepID=A0A0P9D7L0_9BACL|nr:hypothetical protein [Alicyclobacillus ferrooxydans]KPV45296.1 hypothetical protein AN477_02720 [Alicyclobacillus ferrooxydans]
MEFSDLNIRFRGTTPFVFYFENVHLLLLTYERDDAKFLFRIASQSGTDVTLDYPGETFVERVLDTLSKVFFVQVQEGEEAEAEEYVLGSYFELNGKLYAAYYQREKVDGEVVLFRLEGDTPDYLLEPLEGDEYQRTASYFLENYV